MRIGTLEGMPMMEEQSKSLPPLSPEGAFVVQFRSGSGSARFAGRVEHMPSAWATHFGSVEELVAFITRVLAEVRD